ncbi:YcnI family protein [Mycetocola zhujimingii]|nr:YcnI family protein [Mycetocola zhujimingii]
MKRTTLAASAASLTAALLVVAAPIAANAHVSVTPDSAPAGATAQLTFSVGHGCDGSATTALTFTIPEEIVSVTPTVNPNWDVTKTSVDLADPVTDAHGNAIAQRVGEVVYTAKQPLADGFRDTVTLQLTLPADAAGDSIPFGVVQACVLGETAWTEVAADGQDASELDHPAPVVTVTDAVASDAGHGAHAAPDATGGSANAAAPTNAPEDTLARVLGLGGILVGAVGIVFAVATRRTQSTHTQIKEG